MSRTKCHKGHIHDDSENDDDDDEGESNIGTYIEFYLFRFRFRLSIHLFYPFIFLLQSSVWFGINEKTLLSFVSFHPVEKKYLGDKFFFVNIFNMLNE